MRRVRVSEFKDWKVAKREVLYGHGWRSQKRRREESAAATPSQRARRDAEQSTDAAMEC